MNTPQRSRLGLCSAGVVLALTLAGCGDDTTTTSTESTAPATTAGAEFAVKTASDTKLGSILVEGDGLTLYRNTKEGSGAIACTGGCALAWPPLLSPAGTQPKGGPGVTGDLTTVTRPEGGLQVTYNGMPLYRFASDTEPGDTKGQGVGGVWFVVPPSTTTTSSSVTAKPAAATTSTARRPTSPPTTASNSATTTSAPATTAPPPDPTTTCPYPPCY